MTLFRNLFVVLALISVVPLASFAEDDTDWESKVAKILQANRDAVMGVSDALVAPFTVCIETACGQQALLTLTDVEALELRQLFSVPAESPALEREQIGKAIALIERFVGSKTETWRDRPKNDRKDYEEPGQLDCVDESTNTQTYLERMIQAGLIRHHSIGKRAVRFTFIFQHFTATLQEIPSNDRYVVDSWFGANGEEPRIQTYAKWRKGWVNM